MNPTAVVVDIRDGYTFKAGSDGVLFNLKSATEFAKKRNAELNDPAYLVFRLTLDMDSLVKEVMK